MQSDLDFLNSRSPTQPNPPPPTNGTSPPLAPTAALSKTSGSSKDEDTTSEQVGQVEPKAPEELNADDILLLLQQLEDAENAAEGIESRLDGLLGTLDGLLAALEGVPAVEEAGIEEMGAQKDESQDGLVKVAGVVSLS